MKNGVKKDDAVYIFELVDKFAGYGFNKSHAAAYALVSYHTAYLKANYREEFLAASMTLDMGNTDKLAMFAAEARRSRHRGAAAVRQRVRGRLPRRAAEATDGKPGAIRYSLAALKNIGAAAVETHRRRARGQAAASRTLADFAAPLQPQGAQQARRSRRWPRPAPSMRWSPTARWCTPTSSRCWRSPTGSPPTRRTGTERPVRRRRGGAAAARPAARRRRGRRWSGCSTSSTRSASSCPAIRSTPTRACWRSSASSATPSSRPTTERGAAAGRLAGIVISARERRSQKGNKFAFAMFSDATGQFEAVIFSDTLAPARDLLEPGTPVLLAVEAERDGDTLKMRVQAHRVARRGGGRRAARPQGRARPARCIEKNAGADGGDQVAAEARRQGRDPPRAAARRPRQGARDRRSRPLRRIARGRRHARHHPRRCRSVRNLNVP